MYFIQKKSLLSYHTTYLQHKGLIMNILAVLSFWMLKNGLGEKGVDNIFHVPWVAAIYIVSYLAEPWAVRYSMGALNQRRVERQLGPVFLHRWLSNGFLAMVFWGGRSVAFGLLFLMSLDAIGRYFDLPKVNYLGQILLILVFLREGVVVYRMASKRPNPEFKEQTDFVADIVLMVMLAFGQLIIERVFRDVGLVNPDSFSEFLLMLFPLSLFFLVFYLPSRFTHTVEDLTFITKRKDRIEKIISFFVLFLGLLISS